MTSIVVLDVRMRMPDGGSHRVGQVFFAPPRANGGYQASFRYHPEWLENRAGFDLDPRNLRREIGATEVIGERLRPQLGCLEDALPDAWGRSLLRESMREPDVAPDAQLMRILGAGALGALTFSEPGQAPQVPVQLLVRNLEELLDAAQRFERHEELGSASMQRLLAAGGSPGGARPKALVRDDAGMWLAKFPSPVLDAGFDNVGLEASCLELARRARLDVPQSRLEPIGGRRILLVRRFDIPDACQTEALGATHRYHGISMASLVGYTDDGSVANYAALSNALRQVSSSPAKDVRELFRHMLVNAAIGNTDDHLRNFRLLHKEEGWRLAPAYDLLPDVGRRREHAIDFRYGRECPDGAVVAQIAHDWGVSGHKQIVEDVCSAAEQFGVICDEQGVPATDRAFFDASIVRRIAKLRDAPAPKPTAPGKRRS